MCIYTKLFWSSVWLDFTRKTCITIYNQQFGLLVFAFISTLLCYTHNANATRILQTVHCSSITCRLTLMRLSKRQVTARNQSRLASGEVQPGGRNHSSR